MQMIEGSPSRVLRRQQFNRSTDCLADSVHLRNDSELRDNGAEKHQADEPSQGSHRAKFGQESGSQKNDSTSQTHVVQSF